MLEHYIYSVYELLPDLIVNPAHASFDSWSIHQADADIRRYDGVTVTAFHVSENSYRLYNLVFQTVFLSSLSHVKQQWCLWIKSYLHAAPGSDVFLKP
jgi:hypothetical protein